MPICGATSMAGFIARAPRPWVAPAVRVVFLGLDDLLGPFELTTQPRDLALQGFVAARLGLGEIRLGAARLRGQHCVSPASISRRQCVRCELYNPSRRNSAPTSPSILQALASCTMRRLYAAENCRRLGSAATFGIGRTADRDLHCIDFDQRLYLLVHGLHLSTVNSQRKVSHVMLTQGAKKCHDPKMLLYREVGKLGEQCVRLLEIFPRTQVNFVLTEDFRARIPEVYREVSSSLSSRIGADTSSASMRAKPIAFACWRSSHSDRRLRSSDSADDARSGCTSIGSGCYRGSAS